MDLCMKLTYRHQIALSCLLVLLGNILSTVFQHWIYRNIAFFVCGLIWIFHPVMIGPNQPTKKQLWLIRILGGGILILIALFTRSYIY